MDKAVKVTGWHFSPILPDQGSGRVSLIGNKIF
jgi:hypothetical protein